MLYITFFHSKKGLQDIKVIFYRLTDSNTINDMIEEAFWPWNAIDNTICFSKDKILTPKVYSSGKVNKCTNIAFWFI